MTNEKTPSPLDVRVLLFEESGVWVAQGLEFDITTHGRDKEAALARFCNVFAGQIGSDMSLGIDPLSLVGRAPARFWAALHFGAIGEFRAVYVPCGKASVEFFQSKFPAERGDAQ